MRLYKARIPSISTRIVDRLIKDGDIEAENKAEAILDIEAVLKEYLRVEREIVEESKDYMERRGLSYSFFGRIKREVAERKGIGAGDENLSWICSQILETFMHSPHIDEVYAEDGVMRRKIKEILRSAMMEDKELDQEVRERIKNIQEGTAAWEVEYQSKMDEIRRKHGLNS